MFKIIHRADNVRRNSEGRVNHHVRSKSGQRTRDRLQRRLLLDATNPRRLAISFCLWSQLCDNNMTLKTIDIVSLLSKINEEYILRKNILSNHLVIFWLWCSNIKNQIRFQCLNYMALWQQHLPHNFCSSDNISLFAKKKIFCYLQTVILQLCFWITRLKE